MIAEIVGIGTGILNAGMSLFKAFGSGGNGGKLQEKIAEKTPRIYEEQLKQSQRVLDLQVKQAEDRLNLGTQIIEAQEKVDKAKKQNQKLADQQAQVPYQSHVIQSTPVNPLIVLAGAWLFLKDK